MRRDFGAISHNNAPPGGYAAARPIYRPEDSRWPVPGPSGRRPFSRQLVTETVELEDLRPELEIFTVETSLQPELGNRDLPVFAYKKEIIETVQENPITIVVAETGAGKSTQVPQILLDADYTNVYLTQPRRAAARNVFERVKEEIVSVRGPEASNLVAYQTAGEHVEHNESRIKVITDGLQLVKELNNSGLRENDVLIIDEVHEWNANISVIVAWVKIIIKNNPNLKVVIMSATIDAPDLALHLSDVCPKVPPIIEIPGRTFPVERVEKPESTVVQEVVTAAKSLMDTSTDGRNKNSSNDTVYGKGILAFMPGVREIDDAIDEIRQQLPSEIARQATILPLHAKLSVQEQQAALRGYPGLKIVVSTDVAQTSLTIPDIQVVIDSGYQRRIELDDEGTQGLELHTVSQADCNQRAGRTGRVAPGKYVLTRLSAETQFVPLGARPKYPTPEILRTDIIRNTLRIAAIGLDVADLDFYHPVDDIAIKRAKDTLKALGALDEESKVTAIGLRMNEFPVCAASGRMLYEASRFKDTTRSYMAAIVSTLEVGGLQLFGREIGKDWKKLTDESSSDLLAQLDLFIAIQDMSESEIRDYDLDFKNVERARELYRKVAKRSNAVQDKLLPPTLEERDDLKQCIYQGLVNSIYKYNGDKLYKHLGDSETLREIGNRSVVSPLAHHAIILGVPYRVEIPKAGIMEVRHILDRVTVASIAELGKIAVGLTTWKQDSLALRGGKFVEVWTEHLGKDPTGALQERVAEPGPQLREAIIQHTVKNPGQYQKKLREIKKELERLNHLTKSKVRQLTQDELEKLLQEAAPADITDPSIIDNNLRILIDERTLTLDSYISKESRLHIEANAPSELVVGEITLRLRYESGKPLVRSLRKEDRTNMAFIAALNQDILLPDGRSVLFVFEGKEYTPLALQHKLTSSYN